MSSSWDYAQLAKLASEHGGPGALLDDLKAGAKAEGRTQGLVIGLMIGVAVATQVRAHLKKRKLAEVAERELLHGIRGASLGNDPAGGKTEGPQAE
jgi:hypothetical protein